MERATVVIDNGTGFSKMGYAGNMEPSYIVPSIIATPLQDPKQSKAMGNKKDTKYNPELDFFIGDEAAK